MTGNDTEPLHSDDYAGDAGDADVDYGEDDADLRDQHDRHQGFDQTKPLNLDPPV